MEATTTSTSDIGKGLAAALAAAQGEMKNASLNKTNPHFKNRYADLVGLWDTARPVLAKHGLAVIQCPMDAPEGKSGVRLATTIMHGASGESFTFHFTMPTERATAQGVGSAITYARRYAFASLLGMVADEDDDGNGAEGNGKAAKPAAKTTGSIKERLADAGIDTTPMPEPDAVGHTFIPTKAEIIRRIKERAAANGITMTPDQIKDAVAHHLEGAKFDDLTDDQKFDLLTAITAGKLDPTPVG